MNNINEQIILYPKGIDYGPTLEDKRTTITIEIKTKLAI